MTTKPGWTPGRIYNVYRVAIAGALILLHYGPDKPLIGSTFPALLEITLFVYLGLTLASLTLDFGKPQRAFPSWAQPASLLSDVLMLTLVVHANGGLEGGLAVLLLVTVAAGNILLRGRRGFFIAALASMAVMFEQFYFSIQALNAPWKLTESGLLGVAFFMVSLIIQQIAQRLEYSEDIARQQRKAILRLEALNQQIVERMRTGILVFDEHYQILVSNPSANNLFDQPMLGRKLPKPLQERHQRWTDNPTLPLDTLKVSEQSPTLSPRFAHLDASQEKLILLFLEDTGRIAQEAQQMNLASLGRLSATLAHEIRNPLSAINHATELLLDGEPSDEDRHLLGIIRNHVTRVNGIIHNVLDLSRRGRGQAERFSLAEFLDGICEQWGLRGYGKEQLKRACGKDVEVRFDRNQLTQIVDNLIGNGFRHGGEQSIVTLQCGVHDRTGLPWLKISDNGKGIDPQAAQYLFEPFYTTAKDGNGLGLYLCRELCQANQASLELEQPAEGASFVITFAHPHRQFQ